MLQNFGKRKQLFLIILVCLLMLMSSCGNPEEGFGFNLESVVINPDSLVLNHQTRVFSISQREERDFKVTSILGEGQTIRVEILPATGDPDLYVGWDTNLARNYFTCASERGSGKLDACTVIVPNDGSIHVLYIKVYGYSTARTWLRATSLQGNGALEVNGTSGVFSFPADGIWYPVDVKVSGSIKRVAVTAVPMSGQDVEMWFEGCYSDNSGLTRELCELDTSQTTQTYQVYFRSTGGVTIDLKVTGTDKLFSFPIPGENPETTRINSVVDHQLLKWYQNDQKVVDAWGEVGEAQYGDWSECYKQSNGAVFVANGNYTGAGHPHNLCYDGHPGLDIRATTGTELRAGCDGILYEATSDIVNFNHGLFRTIYIDCGNNWSIWILHSSWRLSNNTPVSKGDLVARVGDEGAEGRPHLHIEFRHFGVPVDPYGWQGEGMDPLWILPEVRLWE